MRFFALAFSLLLSACWVGDSFYSERETVRAISLGIYRAVGPRDPGETDLFRVVALPSGLTRFEPIGQPEDAFVAGFAPLPGTERVFVAWLVEDGGDAIPRDSIPYGLVERQPDGSYRVFSPTCDEMGDVAISAGAVRISDKFRFCRFPDRASLETALRRIVPRLRAEGARLIPVSND